ncbi:MAG: GGDEF domain-containing protein [Pseudomonadota bacterium]
MSDTVLGLINPAMAFIFAVAGLVIWWRDTSQRHLLGFVLAAILIAASFTINHYTSDPDQMASRILVALFSMGSITAIAWSACARMGKRAPLGVWCAGAIATLSLTLSSDPARDITVSLFCLNAFCGVVFTMAAQLMSFAKSRELVDRAMVAVFALIAIQFFARPAIVTLMEGPMTAAEYRTSVGHAIFIASSAIFMLILAGVVVAACMVDQFKALKHATETDSLSGLIMRHAFEERASEMIGRAHEASVPVSIVVADLDHFKRVNDLWGHPIGDTVIATFGNVIARTIRPSDIAGRIGGEEFCLLVWDCPEKAAAKLAERLRVQFAREEHEGIGAEIRLTASFGVASLQGDETYQEMYGRADGALYKAKRAGRNQVMSAGHGAFPDQGRKKGAVLPFGSTPEPAALEGHDSAVG